MQFAHRHAGDGRVGELRGGFVRRRLVLPVKRQPRATSSPPRARSSSTRNLVRDHSTGRHPSRRRTITTAQHLPPPPCAAVWPKFSRTHSLTAGRVLSRLLEVRRAVVAGAVVDDDHLPRFVKPSSLATTSSRGARRRGLVCSSSNSGGRRNRMSRGWVRRGALACKRTMPSPPFAQRCGSSSSPPLRPSLVFDAPRFALTQEPLAWHGDRNNLPRLS